MGQGAALWSIAANELGEWIRLCGLISRLGKGLGYNQGAVEIEVREVG
jgi:hypothetical protein